MTLILRTSTISRAVVNSNLVFICRRYEESKDQQLLNVKLTKNSGSQSNGNVDNVQVDTQDKMQDFLEEPTVCCMSGCANCVWLDYAEKLTTYYKDGGDKAIEEIQKNVSDTNIRAFLLQELRMRQKDG